ncbi:MAG: hypothetical protein Q7S66_02085 [bacterium]|nr:hypothetical protein [bacterium]
MNNTKLYITAIICCLILGGSFIIVQTSKQNFIKQQDVAKQSADQIRQIDIGSCLDDAESEYWKYMRLNGTVKKDGTVWADNLFWDRAIEDKQNRIDNCYKRYR